ncbi:MAG: DUF2341 domain-containing protein, partial [Bacteroidota bacterium]
MISVQPETGNTSLRTLPSNFGLGEVYSFVSKSRIASALSPGNSFLRPFLLSLLFTLVILPSLSGQWLDGYCYRKRIAIDPTKVSGTADHSNFPVLISIASDTDLADEANGGLVNDSNGWDLMFTSSDGTTLLDHDVEHYDPTTGEYVAWVEVPILDYNDSTIIFLYFGYDTPLLDPSTSNTWSNGFVSVYHLHDDFLDALGSNNGTNEGSIDIIGGGISGDGQEFDYDIVPDPDLDTARIELGGVDVDNDSLTISAWVKPDGFGADRARIISKAASSNTPDHYWMLSTFDGTELRFRLRTGAPPTTTTTYQPNISVLTVGSWHYVAAVYDGSEMMLYNNGSALEVTGRSKSGSVVTNALVDAAIGNQPGSVSDWATDKRPFDGIIDEVRIASAARSEDWLTTEYNNINAPGSFYLVGNLEDNIPIAAAGSDDDVCGSYSYTLAAIPSVGDGKWTYVSGPDMTPVFSDDTSPTSDVTVTLYGTYDLKWTETNGTCSDFANVVVDFFEKPVGQVSIATQTVCSDDAIADIILSTSNGMDVG